MSDEEFHELSKVVRSVRKYWCRHCKESTRHLCRTGVKSVCTQCLWTTEERKPRLVKGVGS